MTRLCRWSALAAVLANITFSSLSTRICYLWGGKSIGEISGMYPTYFTPSGYAFSIWGLIYVATIAYSVFQLLPSQKDYQVYDDIAGILILSQIITSIWVLVFTSNYMYQAEILIILTFLCSADMYLKIKSFLQEEKKESSNWWSLLSVPFGLYFGWLSVATIAGVGITIESLTNIHINSEIFGIEGQSWAEGLILVATALGIFISSQYRDVVYPAVITWATTAIYMKKFNTTDGVHLTAEVATLLSLGWIAFQSVNLWRSSSSSTSSAPQSKLVSSFEEQL
eukprot:TRINITY_DN2538_c0_g1_i1.p1 TRINITY_DN2538_c0_g1~~TRINITY_DN2538_c0_g1_i1.p1  ORF type:complete len:282 (+),score=75.75 TRINITY_DN2538_c0_g1_i1:63-908(+)